jgi:hypothetical protein
VTPFFLPPRYNQFGPFVVSNRAGDLRSEAQYLDDPSERTKRSSSANDELAQRLYNEIALSNLRQREGGAGEIPMKIEKPEYDLAGREQRRRLMAVSAGMRSFDTDLRGRAAGRDEFEQSGKAQPRPGGSGEESARIVNGEESDTSRESHQSDLIQREAGRQEVGPRRSLLAPDFPEKREQPQKVQAHVPGDEAVRVCLCSMIYNNARFLDEWVRYHAFLGVDSFLIYDNNSEDNLEREVRRLAAEGFRIQRVFWPWIKTQQAGFSHCSMRARREGCTWGLFIDVDEFLHPLQLLDEMYGETGGKAVDVGSGKPRTLMAQGLRPEELGGEGPQGLPEGLGEVAQGLPEGLGRGRRRWMLGEGAQEEADGGEELEAEKQVNRTVLGGDAEESRCAEPLQGPQRKLSQSEQMVLPVQGQGRKTLGTSGSATEPALHRLIRETREAAGGWQEWQGARLGSILFKEQVTRKERPPWDAFFRLLDLDLSEFFKLS